jgi:xylulokinase
LDGRLIARTESPYDVINPQPGWAEQRAEDWLQATIYTVRKCVQAIQAASRYSVAGIGIDSHLEAFVPVDDEGNALANGLLWIDQRTIPQAEEIKQCLSEPWVIETTGVPINHVNPAAKILWLKQHLPDAYARASVLLSPKDYVNYHLTGNAWTDFSIASKTMLLGLTDNQWHADICQAIGLDDAKLPPIQGAWEIAGFTTSEFAHQTGIAQGTPVATGGGDDHCQSLGGGAIEPETLNIGTGTGSTWKVILKHPVPDLQGRVECHRHIFPNTWIYWTGINATGFSVRWFMDNFGLTGHTADDFGHFEKLAQDADIGSNGLFFYPHLWGARAPRFNPAATGVFFGITHAHRTEHFCRAVLEGAAYQYLAVLDLLASLGVKTSRLTMVGGETRNSLWNQIKADMVGHEILIPEIQDGSPLGAAMLAGLATGAFVDEADAVRHVIRFKECIQPIEANTQQYRRLYQRCRAIYDIIEAAYSIV